MIDTSKLVAAMAIATLLCVRLAFEDIMKWNLRQSCAPYPPPCAVHDLKCSSIVVFGRHYFRRCSGCGLEVGRMRSFDAHDMGNGCNLCVKFGDAAWKM